MLVVRTAQQAAEVQLQLETSAQDICPSTTTLCLGKRPWKQERTRVICNSLQNSSLSQLCTSPWSRGGRAESLSHNHHPTQGAPQLWKGWLLRTSPFSHPLKYVNCNKNTIALCRSIIHNLGWWGFWGGRQGKKIETSEIHVNYFLCFCNTLVLQSVHCVHSLSHLQHRYLL